MKWKSIQQQSLLFFISFRVEWLNLKALWCCCTMPNAVKHKAMPFNVLKYRALYVSSLYICNIHITNEVNGPPLCFQLIQSFEDALQFDLIEWTVAVKSNYSINYEYFFCIFIANDVLIGFSLKILTGAFSIFHRILRHYFVISKKIRILLSQSDYQIFCARFLISKLKQFAHKYKWIESRLQMIAELCWFRLDLDAKDASISDA